MARMWKVGEVARLAHVTVRALHHYDDIGLLSPSSRTGSGYRLYGEEDLERLHRILLFRELELPLDAIARLLDGPPGERARALRTQRDRLADQLRRKEAVLRAVDATLDAMEKGTRMDTTGMFEGFDQFDHARYAEEAEERWGDTAAYRESTRRAKAYSGDDWARIHQEAEGIVAALARLMAGGRAPDDDDALDLAERHRQHIDRWFYPCPPRMHAGLADMYQADARFGEYFEKRAEGLTAFVADAIRANAARREG